MNRHTLPGRPPSLIERRVRRIANARSVTFGLALTFIGLAVTGAVVMRIFDPHNFPTVGSATWWALQTVTTVGYGDIVPTTTVGKFIGGVEMVLGIAFITFVTAGVTSTVIQREEAKAREAAKEHLEERTQEIIESVTRTNEAVATLGNRLDAIESKLPGSS
jgi:voltage-gated potassium channel